MNATPQHIADRMLTDTACEREAMRAARVAGCDLDGQLRAALAAIDQDARERARPYLDRLAQLEAMRPLKPLSIDLGARIRAGGWPKLAIDCGQCGARLGSGCNCG